MGRITLPFGHNRITHPYDKPSFGYTQRFGVNRNHPLTKNLDRAWLMNEGAGEIIRDLVHGILPTSWSAAVTWTGKGLTFAREPSTRKIEVPNFYVGSTFSFAMRVYVTATDNDYDGFVANWSGKDSDWFCGLRPTSSYSFYVTSTAGQRAINSGIALPLDRWVSIVYAYDGQYLRIYEDGEFIVLFDGGSYSPTRNTGTSDIDIGCNQASQAFDGNIDYLYHYKNKALSPDEVASLHAEPYAMFEHPELAQYWAGSLMIAGTVCWGHDTGPPDEDYPIEDFLGNWTGTGTVSGTTDAEIITLTDGQDMTSDIRNLGSGTAKIVLNKYGGLGEGTPTVEYKTGATSAACDSDTWHTFSESFVSSGWVRLKVTN